MIPLPTSSSLSSSNITMIIEWYLKQLNDHPLLTKSLTTGVVQFSGDGLAQYYEYYEKQQQTDGDEGQLSEQHPKKFDKECYPEQRSNGGRRFYRSFFYDYYTFRRGLALFIDGLVLSGPLLHYCFDFMERWIPTSTGEISDDGTSSLSPSSSWSEASDEIIATCLQVLINDIIIDSIYIILSFAFTSILEGDYKSNDIRRTMTMTSKSSETTTVTKQLKTTTKNLWTSLLQDIFPSIKASWFTSLGLIPVEFVCFRCLHVSLRVLAMNFIDLVWGAIISFVSHRSKKQRRQRIQRKQKHQLQEALLEHEEQQLQDNHNTNKQKLS
mmetsp:Transcript_27607/g.66362  ORF Transcript_27607/g.66362 Transcript_27607/m.66362 type:complete len:326 (+) Transcript_27607:226-1203(+)